MPNLSKVSDRTKLTPRRDPYWQRLAQGCHIGYRRMTAESAGHWTARWYDTTTRKYVSQALGSFDELPPTDRYDAACRAAQAWFAHLGKGGSAAGGTVRDICMAYVRHVQETRGATAAKDAYRRFETYVLDDPKFAGLEVQKLNPLHLENWRRKLRSRPTASGGNRGGQRSDSSPLMASPNSPTRGHPKFPQAAQLDYDVSGWMAKRAAASLSL